jgi:hypothetical protein
LPVLFLLATLLSGKPVLPAAHNTDIYFTALPGLGDLAVPLVGSNAAAVGTRDGQEDMSTMAAVGKDGKS